jgi:hypothetical protein
MSRRKQNRRKRRKELPKPEASRSWFSRIPLIGRVTFFVIGLPSLYVGLLSVLPRISVAPQENLRSADPLTAPFVVANDGYVDVHAVVFQCVIDVLETPRHNLIQNSVALPTQDIYQLGDIAAGGSTTSFCGHAIATPEGFIKAHVTMNVFFRPDFLLWRTSKSFHFQGIMNEKGAIRWMPSSK